MDEIKKPKIENAQHNPESGQFSGAGNKVELKHSPEQIKQVRSKLKDMGFGPKGNNLHNNGSGKLSAPKKEKKLTDIGNPFRNKSGFLNDEEMAKSWDKMLGSAQNIIDNRKKMEQPKTVDPNASYEARRSLAYKHGWKPDPQKPTETAGSYLVDKAISRLHDSMEKNYPGEYDRNTNTPNKEWDEDIYYELKNMGASDDDAKYLTDEWKKTAPEYEYKNENEKADAKKLQEMGFGPNNETPEQKAKAEKEAREWGDKYYSNPENVNEDIAEAVEHTRKLTTDKYGGSYFGSLSVEEVLQDLPERFEQDPKLRAQVEKAVEEHNKPYKINEYIGGRPLVTESGKSYGVEFKDGKLYAGSRLHDGPKNALLYEYDIDYDDSKSIDENLHDLYKYIEEHEEAFGGEWDEYDDLNEDEEITEDVKKN